MSWADAALMLTSGLLVAAVAVPVGLLARALRPLGEPLLPKWQPWPVPWTGFEVALAFLAGALLPPVVSELLTAGGFFRRVYGPEYPAAVRVLWSSLFALPLLLGGLWLAARALYAARRPALVGRGSLAGKVWLAVLAWLAVTPAVLALNAAANAVALQFDVAPEQHPLTKLGGRPPLDLVLVAAQACVCAPVWEELFFRGVLLSWCVGRMSVPGAGVAPVTAARPWFVMTAAALFALMAGGNGPPAFAAVLAVGLAVLWRARRTGARRARAVYATAALFALGHPVWPTPIPLFVLGLGLGYLAVRTNGVLVPVIVHSLFNAVSVAFVLRT